MTSISGKIIAFRNDRLGARINALLNAIRVSQDYGLPFAMNWPSHESVSPELQNPEHLFSQDFLDAHFFDDVGFQDLHRHAVDLVDITKDETPEAFVKRAQQGQAYLCHDALYRSVLPWENPDDIAARLPDMIPLMGLCTTVRDAMRTIDTELGTEQLFAYHLRRGDIIDMDKRASNVLWPSKYVPRVFYETHIKRQLAKDPNTKIVFFSDTQGEVDAFTAMYDQVYSFEDLVGELDLTALQRDFLELYAMSRCATIYAPAASAFSAVAASMGNSAVVPIMQDLNEADHTEALQTLTHRMDATPEVFLGPADLGQNFPFLLDFHRQNGSRNVARSILMKHMKDGFERAYIYDRIAEEMFAARDWAGAQEVVQTLAQRPVYTEETNSLTYCYAGMTALLAGEVSEAVRLAHISNWLTPIHPHSRALVNVLYAHGLMNDTNSFPIDFNILGFRKLMKPTDRTLFNTLNQAAHTKSNVAIIPDAVAWMAFQHDLRDWTPLQGAKLPPSFMNREKITKFIGFFRTGFAKRIDEPAVRAALSTLLRQQGDTRSAKREIVAAIADDASNPLYHKRLADLLHHNNAPFKALRAIEVAMSLAGDQICYQAQYGLHLFQTGDAKAFDVFETLATRPHNMPEIHLVTADILRRRNRTRDLALDVVKTASKNIHGSSRLMRLEAKILEQMGCDDQATAVRARLASWSRPSGGFATRIGKPIPKRARTK